MDVKKRYLNPLHMTKEEWLVTFAEEVGLKQDFKEVPVDQVLACLVGDALFIGVDYDAFSREEDRPKKWYLIPKEALTEV